MQSHRFSVGHIYILRKDIAEIVIDSGVEVSVKHVDEAEQFLIENLQAPFSLLLNKKNDYSFKFDAQVKMGTYEQLNASAVVCYTPTAKAFTEILSKIPRSVKWNMEIFSDRSEALKWLEAEQSLIKQRELAC